MSDALDDAGRRLTAERFGYSQWVRDRACGEKVRYVSQLEARRVVLQHWKREQDAHEYMCPYGDHWHVSTRPVEEA